MCKNINARFPESSCKVLEAFSIFNIELIPLSSTGAFKVYGNEEVLTLGKHFFHGTDIDQVMSQWKDFRYHLTKIKKKYASLKKQFAENKLKFKNTSTEWTYNQCV